MKYNFTETIEPPVNGFCELRKNAGLSLLDIYPVVCAGWEDPEEMPINYYQYYYLTTVHGKPRKTVLASTSRTNLDLILPVGKFELYVDIVDMLEAMTTVYIGSSTGKLPTQEQVDEFDYESYARHLASIGDQTTLAMLLGAVSSIRDNAEWLSLDPSVLANLTDIETTERLKVVANMNKNQIKLIKETMNFATISQLRVGASVVKKAVEGIYGNEAAAQTVDMETRIDGLEVLEKIAHSVKDVDASSPYDFQTVLTDSIDAGGAIMKGLNNLIYSKKNPPTDKESAHDWD